MNSLALSRRKSVGCLRPKVTLQYNRIPATTETPEKKLGGLTEVKASYRNFLAMTTILPWP